MRIRVCRNITFRKLLTEGLCKKVMTLVPVGLDSRNISACPPYPTVQSKIVVDRSEVSQKDTSCPSTGTCMFSLSLLLPTSFHFHPHQTKYTLAFLVVNFIFSNLAWANPGAREGRHCHRKQDPYSINLCFNCDRLRHLGPMTSIDPAYKPSNS